ncbi:MAG TPA: RnfABCDGE type electron transport complex subunit G [Clostridiales bacterium]|nr:RnfABCDGE type electron transport complex subunit G [Clostridiales bacterium]
MKPFNIKAIAIPTVSLFAICLIVTALLAGTNAMTADTIARQSLEKASQSRSVVLPQAKDFKECTLDDKTYYQGLDDSGNIVGYTFTTAAKGYGGEVQVMTGIDSTNAVSGVVILSQNETPGLGANAEKDVFKDQFKQQLTWDGGMFTVIKNAQPTTGEIQAMTGATITSKAVANAVNEAVDMYYKVAVDKGADK